jgi:Dockerin type I domain
MNSTLTVKTLLVAALCLALTGVARATSTTLNFDAAVPATLLDTNGLGTGLTDRLPGTGTSYSGNSPNMVLNTGTGHLSLTSTTGDPNGPVNAATLDFVGLDLGDYGFTGTQDFIVTASFDNVPDNTILDSFDQFGLYVGASSTSGTRAMVINFDFFGNDNEFAAANTVGGVDSGQSFNIAPTPSGDDLTFTIARSAGFWTYSLTGPSIGTAFRTPAQPTFLNSLSTLYTGVFIASTQETQFTVELDSFSVNVAVPGDCDGDGDVDFDDFLAVSNNLFSNVTPGTMGDTTLDGFVDYTDFRIWKNNYVPPPGSGAGSVSIPEPSGILLAMMASLALACGRRFAK